MVVIDDLLCFGEEEYESFPWMGLHCTLHYYLHTVGSKEKEKVKGGELDIPRWDGCCRGEKIDNPIDRRIMT